MARAKLAQYHLLQGAGAGVGLERENAGENVPARHDVADAQRRRDRFGKRTDVNDASAPAHGVERGRPPAVPDQVGVAIILENRHVVLFRQAQQLVAALFAQDRAGRILHGRDGVDVFGADAAPLRSSSAAATASVRMPSRSSGMPTALTPNRASRLSAP